MRRAEYISDYDVVVGTHLAKVLSGGGEFTSPQRVSEQYLLDLERRAFLSLCGQKKTMERMQYMLKKGKALRNYLARKARTDVQASQHWRGNRGAC